MSNVIAFESSSCKWCLVMRLELVVQLMDEALINIPLDKAQLKMVRNV